MSPLKFSTEGLHSFFERLDRTTDVDALSAMYAGTIMIAGANGTQVVTANDLVRAIPMRRQLLESTGHHATALVGFEEEALTDRYSLVRAEWRWDFQPPDRERVSLTARATFVVDRAGSEPHIILYMNQHDIVAALRQEGLLPPTA